MPSTKKRAHDPEIILVKPWKSKSKKKREPFRVRLAKVLQASFRTPQAMGKVCDQLQHFAVSCGFSESRATDICIVTSEAFDNARKAMLSCGKRGSVNITAICNPGTAIIIFIEDHAGMMGAARLKFARPHKKLAEHGRGGFIMKHMSDFMLIDASPNGRDKDIVLGFYAD